MSTTFPVREAPPRRRSSPNPRPTATPCSSTPARTPTSGPYPTTFPTTRWKTSAPSRHSPSRPTSSSRVGTQASAPCTTSWPRQRIALPNSPSARPGAVREATCALLNLKAGVAAIHVPPAPGDSIVEVAAQVARVDIDYLLSPISIAKPYLEARTLVALGVSTAQRSPWLPDAPTVAEQGIDGFGFPIWYGAWVRVGTLRRHRPDPRGRPLRRDGIL